MIRVFLIFLMCTAGQVQAGAWMREPGQRFLSPSFSVTRGNGGALTRFFGVYHEWGVSPSLTFGADIGQQPGGLKQALVFVRTPLPELANGARTAVEFGIGVIDTGTGPEPVIRPGLAIGYGFGSAYGNGWVGLEASVLSAPNSGLLRAKLDATAGMTLSSRMKIMVQWHTDHEVDGPTFHMIAPSIVMRTGPRQQVQIGLQAEPKRGGTIGLKIALWQEF